MKKFLISCIFFLLLTGVFSAHAETIDRIAAKVGTDIITVSDTVETLKLKKKLLRFKYGAEIGGKKAALIEKDFLNELILETILKQKIQEQNLEVSNKDLETAYQTQLQLSRKSEKEWLSDLENQGLSLSAFKEDMRFDLNRQKFLQKIIMPKIQIADADLQAAYEKHKNEFNTYKKYRFIQAMLILAKFPSEAEYKKMAQTIQMSLKNNPQKATEEIRQYSFGAFKENGGDSGIMNARDINPEIKVLLDRLREGETSQIFYNPGAAFVFKLVSKTDPEPLPFNIVAATLKMQLAEEAIDKELRQYLLNEKDKTFIEIQTPY